MSDIPEFSSATSYKQIQQPNPKWVYGQGVATTSEGKKWLEGIKEGWKTIDTSTEDARKVYALMISGIVPRPIAFVSSVSEDGVANLAPYSWFNQVSASPPVISVSCTNVPSNLNGVKDTVRNIQATKGFVVNIISEPWIEQANVCCVDAPPEVGEWTLSGLTKEPSIHVKAPRVRESAFSMECELLQTVPIIHPTTKVATTTLVLGLVKFIHVRNDVYDSKRGIADPAKLKPVARMGGVTYARVLEGFDISRIRWEEIEEDVKTKLEKDNSAS